MVRRQLCHATDECFYLENLCLKPGDAAYQPPMTGAQNRLTIWQHWGPSLTPWQDLSVRLCLGEVWVYEPSTRYFDGFIG
ncbi:hypothetical protein RRG08_043028 [Elysia crispata]|uniref:Uncharacterized protein n=1 Tax=Elysia crispata TaxID=231223 RepID=A0AAE0XXX8_9GAST|nr:hypothetical protein RRG08_043028 [Elysia crispata]